MPLLWLNLRQESGANRPCPDKLDSKSNVKGKDNVFPLSQFFKNTEICDVMCFGEVDWSGWSGGYWGGWFGWPVAVHTYTHTNTHIYWYMGPTRSGLRSSGLVSLVCLGVKGTFKNFCQAGRQPL